jgi:glycosyltransferase involved in cell wall biosynthesis
MSSNPFFSLIIPTYNRAAFIGKALQSTTLQTFDSFEVIIVDDGSTDNTEAVVALLAIPKVSYFKTQNAERAAARNFGVTKAQGKYITFLDSDDFLLPHHFAEAYHFIELNKQPPIFYQPNNFVDAQGNVCKQPALIHGDLNKLLIIEGNFMSCIGVFLRTDIAQQYKFNTDRALSGTEDHELWLRIATNHTILYNPVTTSSMVQHDNRSVMAVDEKALIARLQLFVHYMQNNHAFVAKYKRLLPAMKTQAWSYLALHFALTGQHKKQAWQFLCLSLQTYPAIVFQKRFWAILKQLILK